MRLGAALHGFIVVNDLQPSAHTSKHSAIIDRCLISKLYITNYYCIWRNKSVFPEDWLFIKKAHHISTPIDCKIKATSTL